MSSRLRRRRTGEPTGGKETIMTGIRFLSRRDGSETAFGYEFLGADLGGAPACVIFVDAEPGQGPRLHKHAYAELFFIIEGQATFTDGETERVVSAGETVVVPADQPHAFHNSGTERLRQIDVHLSPRFITEWFGDVDQPS
jgi:mannose-6-phosphate isomerase-like protein (cupin superfamily)